MADSTYRAGIVGLGFIGGADQVSGDAPGQRVEDPERTPLAAPATAALSASIAVALARPMHRAVTETVGLHPYSLK